MSPSVTSPAVLAPLPWSWMEEQGRHRAWKYLGNNSDITAGERPGHTSGTGRDIKTQETKQKILFYGLLSTGRVCYSLALNNKLLARDRVQIPARSRAVLSPFPSTSRWRHSIRGGEHRKCPLVTLACQNPLPSSAFSSEPHLPQVGIETQQRTPQRTPK